MWLEGGVGVDGWMVLGSWGVEELGEGWFSRGCGLMSVCVGNRMIALR